MSTNPNALGQLFQDQQFRTTEIQFSGPTSAVVKSFDSNRNQVTVIIPSFDGGVRSFGPINWTPPPGVTPTPGDGVLVISDQSSAMWIISQQVAVNGTPPPDTTPVPAADDADFTHLLTGAAIGATRLAADITIIVLHSSEIPYTRGSVADLNSLWSVLNGENLSAHLGINGDGTVMRMVPDLTIAEHVASFNPQALGIEQIGYATPGDSLSPVDTWPWTEPQLRKVAKWVAYWAGQYNIPLVHSTTNGVCRHSDLGASGGGHTDPGGDYPFNKVLGWAVNG